MLELLIVQALVAALATTLLLRLSLPVAHKIGMVDRPGGRKDHARPTPTTGGMAIVAGIVITSIFFGAISPAFASLLVASALLMVVGIVDDARDVRWYWRVLAQVGAALILIYAGGVRVEYVGIIFSEEPLRLGALSVPFTILGTVGVINAINMCDGADGLAGLLCTVALAMLAAAAYYSGNGPLLSVLVPFIAAVGAFLAFNIRSPWLMQAKAFLGNAGSAVLGLVIAWAAFRLTQETAHPVSPALAPWLLAPPLIDCLVLAVRRIKLGRSPFQADRDHVHHLLLDAGFTPTQVALLLAGVSATLGMAAAIVLRTNVGTETHLVLGFALLVLVYYWLTARRVRAMQFFSRLRRWLASGEQLDGRPPAGVKSACARPETAWRRRTIPTTDTLKVSSQHLNDARGRSTGSAKRNADGADTSTVREGFHVFQSGDPQLGTIELERSRRLLRTRR